MSDRETTPASLSLMWNNSLANVVCPQQLEEDLPLLPNRSEPKSSEEKLSAVLERLPFSSLLGRYPLGQATVFKGSPVF